MAGILVFTLFNRLLFLLADTDRSTQSTPTGRTDSEEPLRRAVRASGCGLCGDCTYIYPKRKTLGKPEQKSSGPGPGKPTVNFSPEEKNKTSQKIVVSLNQSPKVTLCDILQNCDACSHSFSSVLPDVLKTEAVHCFKQEMRAGARLSSGCSDGNKTENKKDAHANNREKVCQSEFLTPHQRNTTECTTNGECTTGMKDRNTEQDSGTGCAPTTVTLCRDTRIKLSGCIADGSLPSTSDNINDSSKLTSENGNGNAHFWVSYDSQQGSEDVQNVGSSNTIGPDVTENNAQQKLCEKKGSPFEGNDAERRSPGHLSQSDEVNADEPESFTCQRVRVFRRRLPFSCARTYMCWPFPKCSQTLTVNAGTTPQSAEPTDPLVKDNCDSSVNQKQSDALRDLPTAFSSDVMTQHISHHKKGKEEDRENVFSERNGTAQGDLFPYSSVRKDRGFAPHSVDAEESEASLSSDTTFFSHPSQCGPVSPSTSPVCYHKTDSFLSTASPVELGVSVIGLKAASTVSLMSSPFTNSGSSRSLDTSASLLSVSLLSTVNTDTLVGDRSASTSPVLLSPSGVVKPVEMKPLLNESLDFEGYPSLVSFLPFTQEQQESNEEHLSDRCPPKLEPYYNTSPINYDLALLKARSLQNAHTENSQETSSNDFMLLPVLSPVTSPTPHSLKSIPPPSPDCTDREEEATRKESGQNQSLPGCIVPQTGYSSSENSEDDLEYYSQDSERISENLKSLSVQKSSTSTDEDTAHDDLKITATVSSQEEPCSSSSSYDDNVGSSSNEEELSSSSEEVMGPCETSDQSDRKADCDSRQRALDEFTAFEQDILLVNVIQDDEELFENLPQKSVLKLGPTRITETLKTRKDKASVDLLQR